MIKITKGKSNNCNHFFTEFIIRVIGITFFVVFGLLSSYRAKSQDARIFDAGNQYHATKFGSSLAASGNRILVGNVEYKSPGEGMAYLYSYDEHEKAWNLETQLSVAGSKEFGAAVALSEKYAVIGTYADATEGDVLGAVYIFAYSENMGGWYLEDRLAPSSSQRGTSFGKSVSINGEKVIISAPEEDNGIYKKAGAVYVFARDEITGQWIQEAKLIGNGRNWGCSVSIYGNWIAIGASNDSGKYGEKLPGVVHFYHFDSNTSKWVNHQTVTIQEVGWLSDFGAAVALSQNQAVIGVPESEEIDDMDYNSGSAYVYKLDEQTNSWIPEVKLHAKNATKDAHFGASVDIKNGNVLIGAPGYGNVVEEKKTYLFHFDKKIKLWYLGAELKVDNVARITSFGSAVSLCNDNAVIASKAVDTVYVFSISNSINLAENHSQPLSPFQSEKDEESNEALITEVEPSAKSSKEVCGKIFFMVDEMPEMIGGNEAFQKRAEYPEELRGTGISGRVLVKFVVSSQGEVLDVEIARGVHEILDQKALEIVRRTPFKGGKHQGKPVCVNYTLPVNFKE
ncbi:MAG: TonB family protein [Prolixibacteraceae bacterium]|nr:TonB family protein [Prolixibacteraceae bacterium]